MAVVRTITAHCDASPCQSMLEVPTNTTQVWQFITSQGWALDYELNDGEISTICPDHSAQVWCSAHGQSCKFGCIR